MRLPGVSAQGICKGSAVRLPLAPILPCDGPACGNLLARHPSPTIRRTAANQVLSGRLCQRGMQKQTPRAWPNGSVEGQWPRPQCAIDARRWLAAPAAPGGTADCREWIVAHARRSGTATRAPPATEAETEVSARSRNTPPQRPLSEGGAATLGSRRPETPCHAWAGVHYYAG